MYIHCVSSLSTWFCFSSGHEAMMSIKRFIHSDRSARLCVCTHTKMAGGSAISSSSVPGIV